MRRHADWFRQAERKLKSARWDIQGGFHEDACFSAQQAAELAAKALLESQGRIELGHSVFQLLQVAGGVPPDVLNAARVLDRYYIPTRYPNGFPAGAPMDFTTNPLPRRLCNLQKESWASLAPSFEHYAHTEAVGQFVKQARRNLRLLALILFGSLAKGNYHQRSDADFCVVLAEPPRTPFGGYDLVAACDPSGVVQPVVYGPDQFRQMIREANGLALEVMADGLFLAGDETFWHEIEELATRIQQQLGIERTPTGWRIMHPEKIRSSPVSVVQG